MRCSPRVRNSASSEIIGGIFKDVGREGGAHDVFVCTSRARVFPRNNVLRCFTPTADLPRNSCVGHHPTRMSMLGGARHILDHECNGSLGDFAEAHTEFILDLLKATPRPTARSSTLFLHRTAPVIAGPLQCHIWHTRLQKGPLADADVYEYVDLETLEMVRVHHDNWRKAPLGRGTLMEHLWKPSCNPAIWPRLLCFVCSALSVMICFRIGLLQ